VEYCGVVTGEAILGANIFRDFFAGIRDIVGGRSGAYEKELRKAREIAFRSWANRPKRWVLMRWSVLILITKPWAKTAVC
jgi:uncharacterized protein YbjQ (UPF0145 family)